MKRDITKKITTHIGKLIRSPKLLLTLIIPPIAVIVIGLAVFAGSGLYPFGDKTLAWCDMHQQVLPLLLDFKDILEGKGGFLIQLAECRRNEFPRRVPVLYIKPVFASCCVCRQGGHDAVHEHYDAYENGCLCDNRKCVLPHLP